MGWMGGNQSRYRPGMGNTAARVRTVITPRAFQLGSSGDTGPERTCPNSSRQLLCHTSLLLTGRNEDTKSPHFQVFTRFWKLDFMLKSPPFLKVFLSFFSLKWNPSGRVLRFSEVPVCNLCPGTFNLVLSTPPRSRCLHNSLPLCLLISCPLLLTHLLTFLNQRVTIA